MTPPPVQEHTIQAPARAFGAAALRPRLSLPFLPGDVVALVDVWVLLSVLWVSRMMTVNVDPSVALFGAITFALVVSPRGGRDRLGGGALDDAGRILRRVCVAYAVASAAVLVFAVGDLHALLAVAVATGPLLIVGRAASHAAERTLLKRARKSRTLVVGGGAIARRVVSILEAHDEYGLEVVGAADDDPKFTPSELGTRVLGGLGDVPDLVASHDVDTVIVAFSSGDQAGMVDVIRAAMVSGATVFVVPRFFELGATDPNSEHLWGLPVVRLQSPARSRPEWLLKRAMDFVAAGLGVIFLSPLLALLALLVYLNSGRPILLRQVRVGLDGRPFSLLKFRSMRVCEGQVEGTEWAADAERMTKIGRLLRKTSLDELPQLFNVLKGDMSLVGPRPERPYFVHLFSDLYPNYHTRHRLPAGVTGWAQIHGLRGDTSIEERATFDNYYIENWSLTKDIKILLRTAGAMLTK